jgi:hypothetical protein
MSDEEPAARRGSIGNEIFEQVEKLVREEGLTRTQAFQRLSDTTGRRAGTVAANYYRVARQRGAPLQPRAPRGAGRRRPGRPRRGAGAGGADAALERAMEALQELGAVVRRQEKELAALREQAEQVDRLRTWMSKNM